MKIAIISDIHDNLVNLQKCLNWCGENGAGTMICCGDITASRTLQAIARGFAGRIYLVRGNMEIYRENEVEKYENICYLGRSGTIEFGAGKAGVCHEPEYIGALVEKEIKIIFYGHTHKPWIATKDGVKIINPGTLGGVFSKASFAFWDTATGKLELKILELL